MIYTLHTSPKYCTIVHYTETGSQYGSYIWFWSLHCCCFFQAVRGKKLRLITVQPGAGWLEEGVMNGSLASNFLVQSHSPQSYITAAMGSSHLSLPLNSSEIQSPPRRVWTFLDFHPFNLSWVSVLKPTREITHLLFWNLPWDERQLTTVQSQR